MTYSTTLSVLWDVIPASAPRPIRQCPSCAQPRHFASSGRIRLNANSKRLDAWLIYRCTQCDQTWNRPLLDRVPVHRVSQADLEAMQQSSPEFVRRHEFDAVALRAHCARFDYAAEFTLLKTAKGAVGPAWTRGDLQVRSNVPTGLRLERVLCDGLGISRSDLQKLAKSGHVLIEGQGSRALKKPLQGSVVVSVLPEGLAEPMRKTLFDALIGP